MIARVGSFNGEEPAVYIHGYVSARMFRPQTGRPAHHQPAGGGHPGFPVCVAATKIDNLVLALTPFNHSYDYRSAVVHGTATLLDPGTRADPANRDEIQYAMRLITDSMVTARWDNSRIPDEPEIAATRILKVRIEAASSVSTILLLSGTPSLPCFWNILERNTFRQLRSRPLTLTRRFAILASVTMPRI